MHNQSDDALGAGRRNMHLGQTCRPCLAYDKKKKRKEKQFQFKSLLGA